MNLKKIVPMACVIGLISGCKPASTPQSAPTAAAPSAAVSIETAQALAEKTPSFANYLSLGMAYTQAGRHEEALKAFQQTATISPQSPIAHNNVCSAYNALKRWNLAIENCQKALQIEPGFALAKNNLAFAQKSKVQQDERRASLKQKISAGTDVAKSRLDLGMEHYNDGEYEAAVELWKQIPKDNTAFFANAQNNLGSAYILMKKFDLAKTHLDQAIELQPKNQLFLNNRQWLERASKEAK